MKQTIEDVMDDVHAAKRNLRTSISDLEDALAQLKRYLEENHLEDFEVNTEEPDIPF